jgi:hypothetical protein
MGIISGFLEIIADVLDPEKPATPGHDMGCTCSECTVNSTKEYTINNDGAVVEKTPSRFEWE